MTIDERLERLTERHEALTETVELLARTVEHQSRQGETILAAIQVDAENIRALARIAATHEQRLTELEGPAAG